MDKMEMLQALYEIFEIIETARTEFKTKVTQYGSVLGSEIREPLSLSEVMWAITEATTSEMSRSITENSK